MSKLYEVSTTEARPLNYAGVAINPGSVALVTPENLELMRLNGGFRNREAAKTIVITELKRGKADIKAPGDGTEPALNTQVDPAAGGGKTVDDPKNTTQGDGVNPVGDGTLPPLPTMEIAKLRSAAKKDDEAGKKALETLKAHGLEATS